jgi:hypothetical protein
VATRYIEPDSPWEYSYTESFHSRFLDEFLAMEICDGTVRGNTLLATFEPNRGRRLGWLRFGRRSSGQLPACWLRSACICSRLASGIVQRPSDVPRMIERSPGEMATPVISKPGVNVSQVTRAIAS